MYIFSESFENYATVNAAQRSWHDASSGASSIDLTGSRYGGPCWQANNNSGNSFQYRLAFLDDSTTTYFVSFLIKPRATSNTKFNLMTFNNDIDTIATLSYETDSKMKFIDDDSNVAYAVSTAALTKTIWSRVDVKFRFAHDDSGAGDGGLFEVKVNGTTVMSFPGDNMGNANNGLGVSNFLISAQEGIALDDILIYDNTAGDNLNDFIPDFHLQPLKPISDVSLQLGPVGPTHFNLVNELTEDTTTFINTNGADVTDMFNLETLDSLKRDPPQIHGIITRSYVRDAGPTGNIVNMQLQKAATVKQTAVNLTPDKTLQSAYFDSDVDNNTWDRTAVDSTIYGVKVI